MKFNELAATSALAVALSVPVANAGETDFETAHLQDMNQNTACTIRLNRFTDHAVYDERYIGTNYANILKGNHGITSGITYNQPNPIDGKDATVIDVALVAEPHLNNWLMPNGTYYKSEQKLEPLETEIAALFTGVSSVLYDAKYVNWSHSYQASFPNTREGQVICLAVRNQLEETPPQYFTGSSLWGEGEDTDSYAQQIWPYKPSSDQEIAAYMKRNPSIVLITRDQRLREDRDHNQIPEEKDCSVPPPKLEDPNPSVL